MKCIVFGLVVSMGCVPPGGSPAGLYGGYATQQPRAHAAQPEQEYAAQPTSPDAELSAAPYATEDGEADPRSSVDDAYVEGPSAPAEPQTVRVSIVGALIGPSKSDGRQWDGPGTVDAATLSRIAKSLATRNPYGAAAALIASFSQGVFDKPDPFGYAELSAPASTRRVELPRVYRDTFTPAWATAELPDVPLSGDVRIRVTLIDKDLVADDPIGTVELRREDLLAALRAGNVYPVQVADQSANQLLFVHLSVSAR